MIRQPANPAENILLAKVGEETGALGVAPFSKAAAGCFGKIPARGDFVRFGLSRAFLDAFDDWLQRALALSRSAHGEEWVAAWLEAPVWRFALSPGLAGTEAAIGLLLPSVDRVGRYFPLTFAATLRGVEAAALISAGGGFLDAVERLGREAVAEDLAPEALAAGVAEALFAAPKGAGVAPGLCPRTGALWWTEGAPRRPASAFVTEGLPRPSLFAAMLDARFEADG